MPENLVVKPDINKIKNEKIFASLNHSRKLNKEVLSVWSKILLQNKNIKFYWKFEKLSFDWVSKELLNSGIDKDRLILSKTLKFENYINLHKFRYFAILSRIQEEQQLLMPSNLASRLLP